MKRPRAWRVACLVVAPAVVAHRRARHDVAPMARPRTTAAASLVLLAVGALAPAATASAQGPPTPAREPATHARVTLVLSGGADEALAQVGVLAVLEERRVPVDRIVGCEFGAIIGGLYAAGATPRELEELLTSQPWLDALEGRLPREQLSWRRKQDSRDFLFGLPFGIGSSGIELPRGVLSTRRLGQIVSERCFGVLGVTDFERLQTPFRAVATDLATGRPVVLSSGDLPSALLASAATPAVFAPVEIDGRLLASGSLSNELPVDVALELGTDVVVAVVTSVPPLTVEQLVSFLDVADQVIRLRADEASRRSLEALREQDVLIALPAERDPKRTPDDQRRRVERGRRAAGSMAERLAPLALDEEGWQRLAAQRLARRPAPPLIRAVRFEDDSGLANTVLAARLETRPGRTLDAGVLAHDLARLYGLDLYERVTLRLEDVEDGAADLVVATDLDPTAPLYPRIGAAVEGFVGGDASFVVGAAITWTPLDSLGSEWRNRVELGDRVSLESEFYQPLDAGQRWFVAPSVRLDQRRLRFEQGPSPAVFDVTSYELRLDVGRRFGEWAEVRAGLLRGQSESDLVAGDPAVWSSDDTDQGAVATSFAVDTLDATDFPRQGARADVELVTPVEWLGGEDDSYLAARADVAWSRGRATLVPGVEFDTALDDEGSLANSFALGGFLRLSGLERDERAGAHLLLARVVGWFALDPPGAGRKMLRTYVGGSIEAGGVWLDRDDIELDDLALGGSAFLAVQSPIGPLYVGVGAAEPGQYAAFLVYGGQY